MSGWDLKPTGIRTTLKSTGETAQGLEKQVKSYGTHLEHAASHAGTLSMGGEGGAEGSSGGDGSSGGQSSGAGLVGAALAQFADRTQKDLEFIAKRAGKSISGAAEATSAYLSGDTKMAAEAQRHAIGAPDTGADGHKGGK